MKEFTKGENEVSLPKVLVVNKMDMVFNKRKIRWLLTELEDLIRFEKVMAKIYKF